ncbi:hypothetical protein Trydic_g19530 [Trypoxylus dichotomus]
MVKILEVLSENMAFNLLFPKEANITCDLCGGTDFYYDSGFYYCSECQQQTQDIQEHVYDQPNDLGTSKKGKRVRKRVAESETQAVDRLTTWECYNYIVLGLVNELVELGAGNNFKSTVEVLWFQYLKSLGVVRPGGKPPLLPAFNSKVDAEIVYGRKPPKKPRRRRTKPRNLSPTSATDGSSLDEAQLKRERLRRRRALAKAKHEEALNATQQSNTTSLNQSLGNLKGTQCSEGIDQSKILKYHASAVKAITKKMSKNHFRDHCRDVNSTLTCHKLSHKLLAGSYTHSPFVITRTRIYALLYLGLLINKSEIQLGDMLRYVREGHLSYHHCNHFFPEQVVENDLNVCTFNYGQVPMFSTSLRSSAMGIASLINVKKYLPMQNLVELSERYCKELNLPDEVHHYVINLISKSQPKLSIYGNAKTIPNYEGRVMSLIIFVLKLLFCLDDCTEFDLSNLADALEEHLPIKGQRRFNFMTWLKHIEYRKLVLHENHFPTQYLNDNYQNTESFVGFLNWVNEKVVGGEKLPLDMGMIKKQIDVLKDTANYSAEKFTFKYNLTPFRNYTRQLVHSQRMEQRGYFEDLLSLDFSLDTLEYLHHVKTYKEVLLPNVELEYKHGGKNDDIKFVHLFNKEGERFRIMRREKKEVKVTFAKTDLHKKIVKHDPVTGKRFRKDPQQILENFINQHGNTYDKNKSKQSKDAPLLGIPDDLPDNLDDLNIDNVVYNSWERVWSNFQNISTFNTEETKEFFDSLPINFRLLFRECARVIEQHEKDLWVEYCLTDAYLSFVFNRKTLIWRGETVVDSELKKLVENAKKTW